MAIVSCSNRHFYDNSKYDDCPYCNKINTPYRLGDAAVFNENVTTAYYDEPVTPPGNSTVAMYDTRETDKDSQKTIGIYAKSMGNDYVTGWLVCIKGPERGRDYRIHHGKNKVGRNYANDICVAEEVKMSRESHCIIIYDDKSNQFFLSSCEGSLTYREGSLVNQPIQLKTGDVFSVGDSSFEFVAFCREGRKWEED